MSSVSSSESRPSSPTKSGAAVSDGLKPNPHPYAIKTTSTGILSRSSSSSSSAHSHNHYVPVPPSPTKQHYTEYSERGYRHRYSRSFTDENNPRPMPVPSEDSSYQRSRTGSFSESFDDGMNPKLWTYEQLAENVPEIADFVREHEITGRGFLRFDDGVLDAYGITEHWQRSLILNHSARLGRLRNRNSNTSCDPDAERLSHSNSLSHYTGQHQYPLEEDDPAYLSSSSSMSSASSTGERTKRRLRPNGRVHGMVASYERSTSPEKAQSMRDRSDSTSSIHNEHRLFQPQYNGGNHGRPLPFPPKPTGEYKAGPLLLPQTSFPNSFPPSLNRPHSTGNSSQATPHATGNGVITDHTIKHTVTHNRPLPATPLHPSLRSSPVLNEDFANNSTIAPRREMTMDELIAILDPDAESLQNHAFVNIDRRKARKVSEKWNKKDDAAWEMDIETVKHVLPTPSSTIAKAQPVPGDDELTIEELLALEGEVGATAWMDEPQGIGRTMKRVDSEEKENNARFVTISKGGSIRKGGAGWKSRGYGKQQVRHVGEIFLSECGKEEGPEKPGEEEQIGAEALELERMCEVDRRLLRTGEERQRWERRAAQIAESHKWDDVCTKESEPSSQDEKLRKAEKEGELSQKERDVEEETQHEDHEQRAEGLAAAEQQRQEDTEQFLASSIAENRRLIEEFRIRLERVEQRVEDLEIVPLSSTPDPSSLRTHGNPNTCLRMIAAWALSTPLSTALPAALGVPLADFIRGSKTSMTRLGDEATKNTDSRRDKCRTVVSLYPKIFPRYAILFGLGICAFMLKGFLRWGVKVRGISAIGARGVRGR
ncbi:hypothetical protein H2248_008921 [Termitomyces sp. 'cryptogamus']|nr:hypothetical protein H2248_008921 [Termitomyces sp. 'cryptogamus']